MGNMAFIDAAIVAKLKELHCAYIGKVVSTDGKTATVQPLGLVKEYGSTETKTQAVIADVPVACRYKISAKKITYLTSLSGSTGSQTVAVPSEIEKGDLVVCLCADRDIEEARRGNNVLPPEGMHSITDSIIVGIL